MNNQLIGTYSTILRFVEQDLFEVNRNYLMKYRKTKTKYFDPHKPQGKLKLEIRNLN